MKVTWVQVCEFELLLKTLASVCPAVFLIWASCQSYTQPLPEQIESLVAGQYQKLRELVPPEGTLIVWARVLSPSGSGPDTVPSKAEPLPEWAFALLALGGSMPPGAQKVNPLSKPPFRTSGALDEGVTAFDGADAAPWPFGLDAVTVNV